MGSSAKRSHQQPAQFLLSLLVVAAAGAALTASLAAAAAVSPADAAVSAGGSANEPRRRNDGDDDDFDDADETLTVANTDVDDGSPTTAHIEASTKVESVGAHNNAHHHDAKEDGGPQMAPLRRNKGRAAAAQQHFTHPHLLRRQSAERAEEKRERAAGTPQQLPSSDSSEEEFSNNDRSSDPHYPAAARTPRGMPMGRWVSERDAELDAVHRAWALQAEEDAKAGRGEKKARREEGAVPDSVEEGTLSSDGNNKKAVPFVIDALFETPTVSPRRCSSDTSEAAHNPATDTEQNRQSLESDSTENDDSEEKKGGDVDDGGGESARCCRGVAAKYAGLKTRKEIELAAAAAAEAEKDSEDCAPTDGGVAKASASENPHASFEPLKDADYYDNPFLPLPAVITSLAGGDDDEQKEAHSRDAKTVDSNGDGNAAVSAELVDENDSSGPSHEATPPPPPRPPAPPADALPPLQPHQKRLFLRGLRTRRDATAYDHDDDFDNEDDFGEGLGTATIVTPAHDGVKGTAEEKMQTGGGVAEGKEVATSPEEAEAAVLLDSENPHETGADMSTAVADTNFANSIGSSNSEEEKGHPLGSVSAPGKMPLRNIKREEYLLELAQRRADALLNGNGDGEVTDTAGGGDGADDAVDGDNNEWGHSSETGRVGRKKGGKKSMKHKKSSGRRTGREEEEENIAVRRALRALDEEVEALAAKRPSPDASSNGAKKEDSASSSGVTSEALAASLSESIAVSRQRALSEEQEGEEELLRRIAATGSSSADGDIVGADGKTKKKKKSSSPDPSQQPRHKTTIELLPSGAPPSPWEAKWLATRRTAQSRRFAELLRQTNGEEGKNVNPSEKKKEGLPSALSVEFLGFDESTLAMRRRALNAANKAEDERRARLAAKRGRHRPALSSEQQKGGAVEEAVVAAGDTVLVKIDMWREYAGYASFSTSSESSERSLEQQKHCVTGTDTDSQKKVGDSSAAASPGGCVRLEHIVSGLRSFQVGSYCEALEGVAAEEHSSAPSHYFVPAPAIVASSYLPQNRHNTVRAVHDALVGAKVGEMRGVHVRLSDDADETFSSSTLLFGPRGNKRLGFAPYVSSLSSSSDVPFAVRINVTLLSLVAAEDSDDKAEGDAVDDGLYGRLITEHLAVASDEAARKYLMKTGGKGAGSGEAGRKDAKGAGEFPFGHSSTPHTAKHSAAPEEVEPSSDTDPLRPRRVRPAKVDSSAAASRQQQRHEIRYISHVGECIEETPALFSAFDAAGDDALAHLRHVGAELRRLEKKAIPASVSSSPSSSSPFALGTPLPAVYNTLQRTVWEAYDVADFLFGNGISASDSEAASSAERSDEGGKGKEEMTDSTAVVESLLLLAVRGTSAELERAALRRANALTVANALENARFLLQTKKGDANSSATAVDGMYERLLSDYHSATLRQHSETSHKVVLLKAGALNRKKKKKASGEGEEGSNDATDFVEEELSLASRSSFVRYDGNQQKAEAAHRKARRMASEASLRAMIRESTEQMVRARLLGGGGNGNGKAAPTAAVLRQIIDERVAHQLQAMGLDNAKEETGTAGDGNGNAAGEVEKDINGAAVGSGAQKGISLIPMRPKERTDANSGGKEDKRSRPSLFVDVSAELNRRKMSAEDKKKEILSGKTQQRMQRGTDTESASAGAPAQTRKEDLLETREHLRRALLSSPTSTSSTGIGTLPISAAIDLSMEPILAAFITNPSDLATRGASSDEEGDEGYAFGDNSLSLAGAGMHVRRSKRGFFFSEDAGAAAFAGDSAVAPLFASDYGWAMTVVPVPALGDGDAKSGGGSEEEDEIDYAELEEEKRLTTSRHLLFVKIPNCQNAFPLTTNRRQQKQQQRPLLRCVFSVELQPRYGRVARSTIDYAMLIGDAKRLAEGILALSGEDEAGGDVGNGATHSAAADANEELALWEKALAARLARHPAVLRFGLLHEATPRHIYFLRPDNTNKAGQSGEAISSSATADRGDEAAAANDGPFAFLVPTLSQACDDAIRQWCGGATASSALIPATTSQNGDGNAEVGEEEKLRSAVAAPLAARLDEMLEGTDVRRQTASDAKLTRHIEGLRALTCPPLYAEVAELLLAKGTRDADAVAAAAALLEGREAEGHRDIAERLAAGRVRSVLTQCARRDA